MLLLQALSPGDIAKRAFDLLVCGLALPFLLPLLAVLAVIIKLDSPGPVLYRPLRAGRHGKPFRIFKLRTMVVDAERRGGGTTALDDERILRSGVWLRRYKLDELPQVLNVLRGEMSLVGPRPELLQYAEQYQGEELLILTVRPGITDYSSIEYRDLDRHVGAHDADRVYEERVLPNKNRLRVKYVKERSFWGDIGIIVKTLLCLWRRSP
jgi:lipopolysaccharide/colanic/teichoic acid biosynthesis glycosyltransferase